MMQLKRVRRLAEKHPWHLAFATFCTTTVACASLFYLTPLHFVNLVAPPVNDVDPAATYTAMQTHPERYVFIDVRTPDAYKAGHASGAINIPIHDFYDDRFIFPRSGKTLVLICGDAKLAGVAYGYLELYGFHNLARIAGGLAAWRADGLPLAKGS